MTDTSTDTRVSSTAGDFRIVSALRVKGDRYGHAGIAGLAAIILRELDGDTIKRGRAAVMVEKTGYDKGTVSRVKGLLVKSADLRKSVTGLDLSGIDKSAASLAAAVTIGEGFKRQPPVKGAAGKGKGGDVDVFALAVAELEAADVKQFAALAAQYQAAILRIAAEKSVTLKAA